MKRWLPNVLIAVFASIFVISAGFLAKYYIESAQTQEQFDDLAQIVDQQKPTVNQDDDDDEDDVQSTVKPGYVNVTNPKTGEVMQVLQEYAQLYMMNSDLVGWIRLEGTDMNYPVMQTPDSADFYLKRDFQKNYSRHGCIYAREVCQIDPSSDNVTLYGHNMKDGSMFAHLFAYKKKEFWQENQFITFDSLTNHRRYQVMAVFYTTATEGKGFAYHLFSDAANEEEFDNYVKTCKALAIYETSVQAKYGDELITLSTCEYSQENGRFVVVAKRVD